jgi:nuclear transport factor 2 (NTF2) superfamily protein
VHEGGISYDLVKVFDFLNNRLSLMKQTFYVIRCITGQWFKYYINNKTEFKSLCVTQNTCPEWGTVNQGAPLFFVACSEELG